jgi:hypothetical protein
MAHVNVNQKLSSGMKAVADSTTAFAHTQGLWRFLHNDAVDLPTLSEPVVAMAKAEVPQACADYALAVHDWSRLNYYSHNSKRDRIQLSHETDVGYDLQSTILVSDRDGLPIAVPAQNLVCSRGVLQSRDSKVRRKRPHLDELTGCIDWLEAQDFGKPLVHIVDREADSASHLRQWKDRNWIVRVKAGSTVQLGKKSYKTSVVGAQLTYMQEREVLYKGKPAIQWIGEAGVVLARKAKPKRKDTNGKRVSPIAGEPLPVRLIVSRICNAKGKVLAEWFLLSNLPASVAAERIALWYYFRWEIESFFKLLKEAGHQLESWLQETANAVAKRLLIVAQACAVVWRLMRKEGARADEARAFLVRLSGRQMKRSCPVTPTALMAGYFILLTMLETLQHHSLNDLKQMAKTIYPGKQWEFV